MRVELVYFTGCPNLAAMRALLLRCLQKCHIDTEVVEVNTDDPPSPERYRGLASPAVLVDGVDVLRGATGEANACRLRLPTEAELIAALGGNHEA
jgi:hypothetical protein